jgi:hypothetical protein
MIVARRVLAKAPMFGRHKLLANVTPFRQSFAKKYFLENADFSSEAGMRRKEVIRQQSLSLAGKLGVP